MAHRVPPSLSPASMRALLADSFRSALRIACPGTAPACSKASVRVVKNGTLVEARAPLLLQWLSAALRLLRWARRRDATGSSGSPGRPYPNGPSARRGRRRHRVSGARTARQQQRRSGPHSGSLPKRKRLTLLTVPAFANMRLIEPFYAINRAVTGHCLPLNRRSLLRDVTEPVSTPTGTH